MLISVTVRPKPKKNISKFDHLMHKWHSGVAPSGRYKLEMDTLVPPVVYASARTRLTFVVQPCLSIYSI